jgi:hypothetical protein
MFFSLFFPEKNKPDKKEIDRYGNLRVLFDLVPRFGHAAAPVNIVENQHTIVMQVWQELPEIPHGSFVPVITVDESHIYRIVFFQYGWQHIIEIAYMQLNKFFQLQTSEIFPSYGSNLRGTFNRGETGFIWGGMLLQCTRFITGADPKRSTELDDLRIQEVLDQAVKDLCQAGGLGMPYSEVFHRVLFHRSRCSSCTEIMLRDHPFVVL